MSGFRPVSRSAGQWSSHARPSSHAPGAARQLPERRSRAPRPISSAGKRVGVHRHPRPGSREHQRHFDPVRPVAGEDEWDDREARLAPTQRQRDGGMSGVHVSERRSTTTDARQPADALLLGRHGGGEAAEAPVGDVDDQHWSGERGDDLQRVQSPAVLRREERDQPLEQRHSGVRGGTAAAAARSSRRAWRSRRAARRIGRTASTREHRAQSPHAGSAAPS